MLYQMRKSCHFSFEMREYEDALKRQKNTAGDREVKGKRLEIKTEGEKKDKITK